MNVTVVNTAGPGFLQVYNADADQGRSSNLNYGTGNVAPNLVISPIGGDGTVKLYVNTATHVIVDVIGYFTGSNSAASAQGLFVPFPPDRLVDTHDQGGPLPPGTLRDVNAAALSNRGPERDVGNVHERHHRRIIDRRFPAGLRHWHLNPRGDIDGERHRSRPVPSKRRDHRAHERSGKRLHERRRAFHPRRRWILHVRINLKRWGRRTARATYRRPAEHECPVRPRRLAALERRRRRLPDTHAEVLIRDTQTTVTFTTASNCTVATGQWLDPWTNLTFTAASDVDIDHTVALANAHRSGAGHGIPTRSRAYANDLANTDALRPMDDGTNSPRATKAPINGSRPPPNLGANTPRDWATIKIRWQAHRHGHRILGPRHDARPVLRGAGYRTQCVERVTTRRSSVSAHTEASVMLHGGWAGAARAPILAWQSWCMGSLSLAAFRFLVEHDLCRG